MTTLIKTYLICTFVSFFSYSNAQSIKNVFNNIYGKDVIKIEQNVKKNPPIKEKEIYEAPPQNEKKQTGLFKGTGSNAKYTTCNCELSSIYDKIAEYFDKWQQKGEFEKEYTYKERLRLESQSKFTKICKDVIDSYIKVGYYDENSCKTNRNFQKFNIVTSSYCSSANNNQYCIRLMEYDSEAEQFSVSIILGETNIRYYISVNISEAAQFKKNWSNCNVSYSLADFYQYEGYLVPKTLTIFNGYRNYTINIPKEYLTPIRVYCNDLDIQNSNLTGWYYEY